MFRSSFFRTMKVVVSFVALLLCAACSPVSLTPNLLESTTTPAIFSSTTTLITLTPTTIPTTIPTPTVTPALLLTSDHKQSRADFDFLKPGISYSEIENRVGAADRDIGSGIYIFVYTLDDGSKMYLSFVTLERLEAASITRPDGSEEILFAPPNLLKKTG